MRSGLPGRLSAPRSPLARSRFERGTIGDDRGPGLFSSARPRHWSASADFGSLRPVLLAAALLLVACTRPVVRPAPEPALTDFYRPPVETYRASGQVSVSGAEGALAGWFDIHLKGDRFRFRVLGPLNIVLADLIWRPESVMFYDGSEVTTMSCDSARFLVSFLPFSPSAGVVRELFLQSLPDSGQLIRHTVTARLVTLVFPDRTYTLSRPDYLVRQVSGDEGDIFLFEFEDVGGRRLPRLVRIKSAGSTYEFRIEEQDVNIPLDDRRFAFPPHP